MNNMEIGMKLEIDGCHGNHARDYLGIYCIFVPVFM